MAHEELLTVEYMNKVFGFISARTKTVVHAEDLSQDALLHMVMACRRDKAIAYPRAVFGKIIRDTICDFWRRRKPTEVDLNESIHQSTGSAEYYFDQKRKIERIEREMRVLEARERNIFELFYFEDMAVKEIAKQLGMSESAIKTGLMRSRRKVKYRLNIVTPERN